MPTNVKRNVKRVVAVLVSIVWLSLIGLLAARFFVPSLQEILPAQVRELTDPAVLRERLDVLTDSLSTRIDALFPAEPEGMETATPDPGTPTPPPATPVPPTPTITPLTPESVTPEPELSMGSDGQPVSISVAVIEQTDLRAAPSADADVIGLVAAGATVTVNGKDPSGRWYRLEDGMWIGADALVEAPQAQVAIVMAETQQPTAESVEQEQPTQSATPIATSVVQPVAVKAVVNADANLRSGPGVEFDRVDGVYFDSDVMIVGKSADNEWYLLESGAWLFTDLITEAIDVPVVTEDGALGSPPASDTDPEQPGSVTNAPANLRSGPGLQFDRVGGVDQGHVLTIVAQDPSGEWLKLEDGSWIFVGLVDNAPTDVPVEAEEVADVEVEAEDIATDEGIPDEAPASTDEVASNNVNADSEPVPDASEDEPAAQTSEDKPVASVVVNVDANLRDGPGLGATIVGSVPAGTKLIIVGQSADGQWLKLDNGQWVFAALVDNAPADVPVEAEEGAEAEDTEE